MKNKIISVAITALIVTSLLAAAQPASAVQVAVDGPDEVQQTETVTFRSSVDMRDGENVSVESFTLTIQPEGEDTSAAEVTFAPDGTVLETAPETGVVGNGQIRMDLLRRTIDIEPVNRSGGYGYADEGSYAFDIEIDAKALKHGDYTLQMGVNTAEGDNTFVSNTDEFSVVRPSSNSQNGQTNGQSAMASGISVGAGNVVPSIDVEFGSNAQGPTMFQINVGGTNVADVFTGETGSDR